MLAVWCFVFAAVGERLAVSGGGRSTLVRDASLWDWFSPEEQGDSSDIAAEVTYPKRLVQQMESEEEMSHGYLDTRVKNTTGGTSTVHLAQSCFQVEAFGHTFTLDLELNHNLLSSDYVERHFHQDGKPSQSMGGEHCYYQGRLRGLPESWGALSTCLGLCGMFSDGMFTYGIEPLFDGTNQTEGAHLVRRMPDVRLSPDCPDCTDNSEGDRVRGNGDEQTKDPLVSEVLRRSKRQLPRRPTVQSETKYIELMVVNDYEMFVQLRRSTTQARNFAKAVVNMADAIYREQLNTRIVLVAMETWSSANMVPVVTDPLTTLQNFMKYRKDSIKEQSDVGAYIPEQSKWDGLHRRCVLSHQRRGHQRVRNVRSVTSVKEKAIDTEWMCVFVFQYGNETADVLMLGLVGGGSCLFNKPNKLLDPPECGNGFVETGEECDCGSQLECARSGGACCKKCTLTHDAMCSSGLCCRGCRYELRGAVCRQAVNDCDIPESCTGDSSQGRCYSGRCRTLDGQCKGLWGYNSADRFCYEKLNAEGTEKGNCGRSPEGQGWLQCNKPDVLCGFLFCANMTVKPKFGDLEGEVTSLTIYHQNKYLDCRGGHVLLEDGSDLGYVEDGTPCGPNMMCLERRCLPVAAFNLSTCSGSTLGRTCSDHGTCSNEVKCICDRDYTAKDCMLMLSSDVCFWWCCFVPLCTPPSPSFLCAGPSGTNIIIGSIAGAILLAAIVLGGTGWGFK
ncbi:unnamed protein product [Coregonus sp. 'balchen']|nr:unnamed protein product [Coregonus sp. 'balchen']